jgi:hypothetical protein
MVRGRLKSNGLQTLQRELHFGVLGILLGCEEREREKLPRVFEKQQCLPHHLCRKFNVHAQHLTPLKARKAAAPPPHGAREFNQEELVAPCLCSPSIPIYPSTTIAVRRISSQSAPNGNRGGNLSSRRMQAFLRCSSLNVCLLCASRGLFTENC